ncbi:UNVERIFIED_CONTAM: hypothetical protein GTU68_054502 [Idotea baltica]|nr:hypothetical protein [Idotea baltica]
MVISIKDVLCYKEHEVTAGSKMLRGFRSQFTSTAVQRAIDAGAIIIGRTNCDEFAMGSTNENSYYGPTLNGLDKDRVPGGSSGGAAVAVQKNTCLVSLGSDTGGSVRQPAAFCGVVGMKPTYGCISRYGLIAYASSFDQIGLVSHNVEDLSRVLSVIGGHDPLDSTSLNRPAPALNVEPSTKKYKIATIAEISDDPTINSEVSAACDDRIQQLKKQGHEVESISFDLLPYLVPTYYVLTTAEASSNLSRYDGIRYGHRAAGVTDINSLYIDSRSEGFGIEVKRRIMMGTFVLSVGHYDAYFAKAQSVRRKIVNRLEEIFKEYDFILMPTTTNSAPKVGEMNPMEMYLSDVFTVLANIGGIPAISLPHNNIEGKMPVGVQLLSRTQNDEALISLSLSLAM